MGSSDVVQISNDLGNNIQDRSWMLYLLELLDSSATASNNFPIELNLFVNSMSLITSGQFLQGSTNTGLHFLNVQ